MINKLKNNKLFVQIFRFGIVGGLAFIIDYSVMILCRELFNFSVYISTAFGFCISVIFNYIASVKWVFDVNEEKNDKTRNFILFIVFSVIGLIITEIVMRIGTDMLNFNYKIVKIFATAIVMVFNFITRKMFLE